MWFMSNNIPNFLYITLETSWTLNSIDLHWLDEVFLPKIKNNEETQLLLMNDHESHTSIQFIWKCYKNNVLLIYLIPHLSHVL
jgi:DDE superfamily endonuclease